MRKNPTSSIRSGLTYQDLWLLDLGAQWLKAPHRWHSIEQETYPSEIEEGRFFFDDIIVTESSGKYRFYQIKHRQNEQDFWTWDNFLTAGSRNKQSLFKKWSQSLGRPTLVSKIAYAAFITNGRPDPTVSKYLKNEHFDLQQIKEENTVLFQNICEEVEGEQSAFNFFEGLEFKFEQPGKDVLEKNLLEEYCRELGATKDGFNSLWLAIKHNGNQSYPDPITLADLREWCQWDEPRPLNQNFLVPEDFILFERHAHSAVKKDLKDSGGGIKVVYGKPGVGKSTYLSNLVKELLKAKIPVIRHHYHISTSDPEANERLDVKRLVEALKYQFKELPNEMLGDMANKNSESIAISEFIDTVAKYGRENGKCLIMILDGIDHAQTYGDRENLQRFLRDIIRPQGGVWFVLGMQYIAKDYLPSVLFDHCPESAWMEIKGLSKEGVRKIVDRNQIGIKLPPKNYGSRQEIIDQLFECSQGLPLYLRYALAWLKDSIGKNQINLFDVQRLPAYDGDITNYYRARWVMLPVPAKWAVIALGVFQTPLTLQQFTKVMSHLAERHEQVQEAIVSIMHLLSIDPILGGIRIFHNSFALFIQQTEEYQYQRDVIVQRVLEWLRQTSDDDLRWAEEKRIEYLNGNNSLLLSLDREWLVQSILDNRPAELILNQLDIAGEAAFKAHKFGKVLEVNMLHGYFSNIQNYQREYYELIQEQILDKSPIRMSTSLDLRSLPPRSLYNYAKRFQTHLSPAFQQAVFDLLKERHNDKNADYANRFGDSSSEIEKYVVKIAALDRKFDYNRIYQYVAQFRPNKSGQVISIYIDELVQTRQLGKLKDFLNLEFSTPEIVQIILTLSQNEAKKSPQVDELLAQFAGKDPMLGSIFHYIIDGTIGDGSALLPSMNQFPEELKSFETELSRQVTEGFIDAFLASLQLTLQNQPEKVEDWKSNLPNNWSARAAAKFALAGQISGSQVLQSERLDYKRFFAAFEDLDTLHFGEHSSAHEFSSCLRDAIKYCLEVLIRFNRLGLHDYRISLPEFLAIQNGQIWGEYHWLEFFATGNSQVLSIETYKTFINSQITKMPTWIVEFNERSKRYSLLARIADLHNDDKNYQRCIRLAVENALGYGDHKEMFLHQLISSVENGHENGSVHVKKWLSRLTPLIWKVEKYTDGDETGSFPNNLIDLFAKVDVGLLYNAYLYCMESEDYQLADSIWYTIIKSWDFTSAFQTDLALTAVERSAYAALQDKAEKFDNARVALERIHQQFGSLHPYPETQSGKNSHPLTEKEGISIIPLDQINRVIKESGTTHDRDKLLTGWFNYWNKLPCDRYELFETAKKILDTYEWHTFNHKFFEAFYDLAYEYDLEVAYECLVWIQARDSEWSPYWSNKSKAHWTILKRDFPEKITNFQFLTDSVLKSGLRYGNAASYFISIPKMVEFFNYVDQKDIADEITEHAIALAESFMIDLQLPETTWFEVEGIDELDLLFARQIHPSPLVRERSAVALSRIISTDSNAYHRYLITIEQESLPTLLVIRLLPLLKAMEAPNHNIPHFDFFELIELLPYTTVVIEKALYELSMLYSGDQVQIFKRWPIARIPDEIEAEPDFEQIVRKQNVRYELMIFKEIEKNTNFLTLALWSFYTSIMIEGLKTDLNQDSLKAYNNNYYEEWMVGASSVSSEVLRSSWLWALEYLFLNGVINEIKWLKYSFFTFPVNLSLWRIKSNSLPVWWQNLASTILDFTLDPPKFLAESLIIKSISISNQRQVLAVSGNLRLVVGDYQKKNSLQITVLPFTWKGDDLSGLNAEFIYSELAWQRFRTPFHAFDDEQFPADERNKPMIMNGIEIMPLIAFLDQWESGIFQWYRRINGIIAPLPYLRGEMPVHIEASQVLYGDQSSPAISWQDWVDGVRNEANTEIGIRAGQWMEIDIPFLNNFLLTFGCKLGYVVKQQYIWKDEYREKAKNSSIYQLISV